ncbi:MAG TPA: YezD family protein [Chthoniobacterales bacterium]|jgi:hypothetical protein
MKTDLSHVPQWLSIVREKVESLRYGAVQIVVHNSKITQIERTEKVRFEDRDDSLTNQPDKLEALQLDRASHRTAGRRS